MASINLGGLVKDGDKYRLSGISSQLDSNAIIEATIEAKKIPIQKIEDSVKLSDEKVDALFQFQSLLHDLKESSKSLRGPTPYGFGVADALNSKKVYLTSSTIDIPASYVEVMADSTVPPGNFNIQVNSLATAQIQQSVPFASLTASATNDPSSPVANTFTAGTFQINGISVTLADGDTLPDIAAKINALTSQSNVSATIIKPSISSYGITIQSTQTGFANAYVITDTSNVLNGVFSGVDANVQAANDASFTIDNNITVTRPTNYIDDYISGLSITLHAQTASVVNVDIDYDKTAGQAAIIDFVNKYNTFVQFASDQQARDANGNYLPTAKIRRSWAVSDSLLNISGQLGNVVANNFDSNGNSYNYLDSIGIGFFSADNAVAYPGERLKINVDTQTLTDSLQNNFSNVLTLLEFQSQCSSPNFLITDRSNNLGNITNFTISINTSSPLATAAQITYGTTTIFLPFTPSNPTDLTQGGFITGQTGTPFDGFRFQYTGTGIDTGNYTVSQGVMDTVHNAIEFYLDKQFASTYSSGINISVIELEIEGINSEVQLKNDRVEYLNRQIETTKKTLIAKYARLEAAIAKANSIMQFLEAQQNAMKHS
ncbi:MAG: flagellar filament capping protein FliD [Rickettsiales bacterium]